MKKSLLILLPLFLFLLVGTVQATVTVYSNSYIGLPDYDTFLRFDDTRSFDTIYHTGDKVYIDDYVFTVQNANLTINEFFDSPNYLEITVSGTAGLQSEVTIDADSYGYDYTPSSITYTGDVINQDTVKNADGLTLYANHETTGDIIYQIVWTGDSSIPGTGYVPPSTDDTSNPPSDDSTTDTPEPDGSIIDDVVEEIENLDQADLGVVLIGIALVGIVGTGAFVKEKNKKRKPKDAYKNSKRGKTKKPNYQKKYN